MNKPFFSIIMPVYNSEKYLEEAIQSVMDQAFTNWELHIIDDGSADISYQLADEISKKDDRIKLWYHNDRENKGVSASRNLGIKQAKGTWIALLDADDSWLPEKLAIQAEIIQQHDELALIYCKGERLFTEYSGPAKKTDYGSGTPGLLKEPFLKTLSGFELPTSGVVLNKEMIHEIGGFDETMDYSEDTLLFHNILLYGDLYYIDQPLVVAKHHDASAKQKVEKKKMIQARLAVYLKLLNSNKAENYQKRLSYQAATTGLERVWKYFLRNPLKYGSVLCSALGRVFVSKKVLWHHKMLALILPLQMVGKRYTVSPSGGGT